MGTVDTDDKTTNGPGQIPAIPHPIPKHIAPKISCQSTFEFWGSKTGLPFKLVPLLFMMVNVTRFTKSPDPSTKRRAGFHWLFICRKWRILDRLDIPEIMSPNENMAPTIVTTNWSRIPVFPKMLPRAIETAPTASVTFADRVWSEVASIEFDRLPAMGPNPK